MSAAAVNPLAEVAPAGGDGRISIRNLHVAFTVRRRRSLVAVEDVSLEIEPGEFVALLGPSGCGKTTVLNAIAGFVTPVSGEVRIDGRKVEGATDQCGIVFQQNSLFPWMTAQQNVAFGPEMKRLADAKAIASRYLAQVGLSAFEHAYPATLSGGMRQRVGIARALASGAPILLMDEPFGALDAQTRGLMQEQLLEIWDRHRKTVVFVTHDIDEAIFLADRVIVMGIQPGHVREDFAIPLPRPRDVHIRHRPEYAAIHSAISDVIREESLKSFQETAHVR